MKEIRIRSIENSGKSPWVLIQEHRKAAVRKEEPLKINTATIAAVKKGRTNQFGRFRYSEYQYGRLEGLIASSMEISTQPMRIRTNGGGWIYFGATEIKGACPAIRIRSSEEEQQGPWVYIQQQEV